MAPIDINNQEISSITLNGNTDIDTVTVDGQTVFTAEPDIPDSGLYPVLQSIDRDSQIQAQLEKLGFINDANIPNTESTDPEDGSAVKDDGSSIYDWNDFDQVRNDLSSSASYTLQNSLDSSTDGYAGIGDSFNPFDAPDCTIDGNGFVISDLLIDGDGVGSGRTALFAGLTGVTLSDIGFIGEINAPNFTGGVGGVLGNGSKGDSGLDVQRCFAYMDVNCGNSSGYVGGFASFHNDSLSGTLKDCYSLGDVSSGSTDEGGFVGRPEQQITTCYSIGSANNGFDAFKRQGTQDCYWDTEESGTTNNVGSNATGLTTDEMTGENAPSNLSGFDFSNIWETIEG